MGAVGGAMEAAESGVGRGIRRGLGGTTMRAGTSTFGSAWTDRSSEAEYVNGAIRRLGQSGVVAQWIDQVVGGVAVNLALGATGVGEAEPGLAGLEGAEAAAAARTSIGSGKAYSVAFETTLPESVLGRSYGSQFNAANEALIAAMKSDPAFAKSMSDLIPEVSDLEGVRGGTSRSSRDNWTWHHVADRPGVVQLVPTAQHTAGGSLQQLFHPGDAGGMANSGR